MEILIYVLGGVIATAAIVLAYLRKRGVKLPWWLDWLGAAATPVVSVIVGLLVGQLLFRRPEEPTPREPERPPDLPRAEPPTNDVAEIINQSGKQLSQEPPDDIHDQLHDALKKYRD